MLDKKTKGQKEAKNKQPYTERARECVAETKAALQAVYNDLNQGQRKKLLRNPAIRAMFERYGVAIDAADKKE